MMQQTNNTKNGKPNVILPAAERAQADKAAALARSMEDEAKRFAITYMRAYQAGYRSGMEQGAALVSATDGEGA